MELERQLGIQDAAQQVAAPLSSLRHPDGASDPHLNHHSSATYETDRPGYFTSTYNAEIGHYNTLIAHIKYIIIDVD